MSLTDQLGRQVYSEVIIAENEPKVVKLNANLSPGLYMVVGESDETLYKGKLMVTSGY